MLDVPPERLRHYESRGFLPGEQIDPGHVRLRVRMWPSTRLFRTSTLISCRNVLIYLTPALQKRVMPIFHYALKPNGVLFRDQRKHRGGLAALRSDR